jgi:hypothetical protein
LERSNRKVVTTPWRKIFIKNKEIILGFDTAANQNEIINHIILEVKYYTDVC